MSIYCQELRRKRCLYIVKNLEGRDVYILSRIKKEEMSIYCQELRRKRCLYITEILQIHLI